MSVPAFTLTIEQLSALVKSAVADALAEASQDPAPLLLDRNGIAKALASSVSQIDKLRKEGMPYVRLGDPPRFEAAVCLAWLRERR